MEIFYRISTEDFKPISHKNRYLYDDYERVSNLLAGFLDKNKSYKFILAKPVKNDDYRVEWFSPYSNLQDVRGNKSLETEAYKDYFEFLELIDLKIRDLKKSNKPDNQNWAGILAQIFKKEDNLIFSNGKDISIIWGWQFNNNEIYKPDIRGAYVQEEETQHENEFKHERIQDDEPENIPSNGIEGQKDDIIEDEEEEIYVNSEIIDPYVKKQNTFIEFLKSFAAKYWWILIALLILIALVFTLKALKFS